jgi:hypothetical protein
MKYKYHCDECNRNFEQNDVYHIPYQEDKKSWYHEVDDGKVSVSHKVKKINNETQEKL